MLKNRHKRLVQSRWQVDFLGRVILLMLRNLGVLSLGDVLGALILDLIKIVVINLALSIIIFVVGDKLLIGDKIPLFLNSRRVTKSVVRTIVARTGLQHSSDKVVRKSCLFYLILILSNLLYCT